MKAFFGLDGFPLDQVNIQNSDFFMKRLGECFFRAKVEHLQLQLDWLICDYESRSRLLDVMDVCRNSAVNFVDVVL